MHHQTQPSFVQIMACHLFSAKPLSESRNIVNWTLANIFRWNFNQNTTIFIEENAFENVGSHSVSASMCEYISLIPISLGGMKTPLNVLWPLQYHYTITYAWFLFYIFEVTEAQTYLQHFVSSEFWNTDMLHEVKNKWTKPQLKLNKALCVPSNPCQC